MKKAKPSYQDLLKQDLSELVDELELPDIYRRSMKSRWLDQVLWTDKKASQAQKRFYFLRLTTVIGGVIIPALVAFNNFGLEEERDRHLRSAFPLALFGLTQVVAVCTAIEEFCQYGARWRQYRATAEGLKSEGWQFFQLSGAYRKAGSHLQAYPVFSTRVERIIRRDVQTYLTEVVKEQKQQDEEEDDRVASNSPVPNSGQLSPISSNFFANTGTTGGTIEPLTADEVIKPNPPKPHPPSQGARPTPPRGPTP